MACAGIFSKPLTEPTMSPEPPEIAGPETKPSGLFTIGHSTHPLDEFLGLLSRHGIEALADIRRFPGSRKYPHFNRDHLASALPPAGVEYRWFEALGGRRKGSAARPGTSACGTRASATTPITWRPRSSTRPSGNCCRWPERKRTAFMCSEGLYWRCHRRLVSDYLLAGGSLSGTSCPTANCARTP